jgi:8-oxo-dGTP pyrophosphatase MutT (NUDIX family)
LSASTWPPELPDGVELAPGAELPRGLELPERGGETVAAAVLVALFDLNGETGLVLTRRRADLRSHAGEISFPGGRRDAEDADLSQTALREAEEEIGLPRAQVRLLGELPPVSTFVTGYVIHPFIAAIPTGLAWSPSVREVDAVLELSVEQLRASRTRTPMERRGITFETDAYIVGDQVIWGATARIIEHLLERLPDGLPGLPGALGPDTGAPLGAPPAP